MCILGRERGIGEMIEILAGWRLQQRDTDNGIDGDCTMGHKGAFKMLRDVRVTKALLPDFGAVILTMA